MNYQKEILKYGLAYWTVKKSKLSAHLNRLSEDMGKIVYNLVYIKFYHWNIK